MQGATKITHAEYDRIYSRAEADYFSIGEVRRIVSAVGISDVSLHNRHGDLDTTAFAIMRSGSPAEDYLEAEDGVFCISFYRVEQPAMRIYKSVDDWYWTCIYYRFWSSRSEAAGDYWKCDQLPALLGLVEERRNWDCYLLGNL